MQKHAQTLKLATLTIGQAPRADIDFGAFLGQHFGLLDGLSLDEINARFAPDGGEILISRLLDGSFVKMSAKAVHTALEAEIAKLENDFGAILLLCTGSFAEIASKKALLIKPDLLLPPLIKGLAAGKTLGLVLPLKEQEEAARAKFCGLDIVCAFINPYAKASQEDFAQAAQTLAQADLLLFDCFGFSAKHEMAMRQAFGQLKQAQMSQPELSRKGSELELSRKGGQPELSRKGSQPGSEQTLMLLSSKLIFSLCAALI